MDLAFVDLKINGIQCPYPDVSFTDILHGKEYL
jgi:hypothetical protein